MSIEVRTTRTARERMTEWEVTQAKVWEDLDNMSFVLGQFATIGLYDYAVDADE